MAENAANLEALDKTILQNQLRSTTGYNSKNPVIPQGFRPVTTEGGTWTYTGDEVTGGNDGLIITDDSQGRVEQGNEFVWVPCQQTIGTATDYSVDKLFHGSGLNVKGYQKNIADLGGNLWEWSAEYMSVGNSSQDIRPSARGGYAYGVDPASYSWCEYSYRAQPSISFRIVLYVQ